MLKKILPAFITVMGVLIIISAYFGYQYWRKGAPEYSFQQLQNAFKDHDTINFSKYYDAEAISNNDWPRIKSGYQKYILANSSSELELNFALAQFDNFEKTFKESFKNESYKLIREGSEGSGVSSGIIKTFLDSKPIFKGRANGVVSADFTYQAPENKSLQLTFIIEQQSDRLWKITDIQGLEDVYIMSIDSAKSRSRDARRIADIKQLQLAAELYYDANNGAYPATLSVLAPIFIPVIPTDPLSHTDYQYAGLISDAHCTSYHMGATLEGRTNKWLDGDADAAPSTALCNGSGPDFSGADPVYDVNVKF